MLGAENLVHLVNRTMNWQLSETADGTLTDGDVSEEMQRDVIHQIVRWLKHFPERLPQMEALTPDGRQALYLARACDHWDGRTRW